MMTPKPETIEEYKAIFQKNRSVEISQEEAVIQIQQLLALVHKIN